MIYSSLNSNNAHRDVTWEEENTILYSLMKYFMCNHHSTVEPTPINYIRCRGACTYCSLDSSSYDSNNKHFKKMCQQHQ